MGIRKRVTDKQLQANRQNSLKSTGPKTLSGKTQSSRNSLKHGILSATVVVPAGSGQENAEQFTTMLAALRNALQPCGALEDLLVEQIASDYWRLRRVRRFEAGEITKNSEIAEISHEYRQYACLKGNVPEWLRRFPEGVSELSAKLDFVELELKSKGFVSDDKNLSDLDRALEHILEPVLGLYRTGILEFFNHCLKTENNKNKMDGDHHRKPSDTYDLMLNYLNNFVRPTLEKLKVEVSEKENTALNGALLSASLPSSDAMDRIQRYETSILRSLDRATGQLERLQLRRKGLPVPPTLKVQFGR